MMAKSRSAFLSVLWVFIGLVALACMALSDNCRSIQFEPLITNKALLNHAIKTLIVKGQGSCEARCYQDENCVSYNFGPVGGTLPNCELNRVTHQQALEGEFVSREGYIYRHILNKCQSNPCLNNSTCQAGFTSKAYRCICVDGYEGEHCEDSGSVPWSCYKRTCYLLFTELQTWHNAQAACIRYGGFLAKIENSAINKFLKDEFFVTDGMYWIGLSDSVKEGKWIWEDQTELKGFQGWDKNEPNGNSLENCAGIGKILLGTFDGEWFDSPCHIPRGFICQKK